MPVTTEPVKGTIQCSDFENALLEVAKGQTNHGNLYSAVLSDDQSNPRRHGRFLSEKAVAEASVRSLRNALEANHDGLVFDIKLRLNPFARIEELVEGEWKTLYTRQPNGWVHSN